MDKGETISTMVVAGWDGFLNYRTIHQYGELAKCDSIRIGTIQVVRVRDDAAWHRGLSIAVANYLFCATICNYKRSERLQSNDDEKNKN